MKKLSLFLFFVLNIIAITNNINAQYIPIDSVRKHDANFVPLTLGQTVTVRGIITMSNELGSPYVYFQDASGGLVGYDNTFWTNTNAGDSHLGQ